MQEELVRAAQAGDREAFSILAATLGVPFLATSRRILRDLDLAEDATQEALVAIWRGLPTLRDRSRFEAWAYRVLVRMCRAQGARARMPGPIVRVLPVDVPDRVDDVGVVIDRDELERAFRRLSIDHRAALVLRYFLDLPLDRVAEVQGVPEGTAASRLHYATQALRTAIEADARPGALEATHER